MRYSTLSDNAIKVSAIMITTTVEQLVFTDYIASSTPYDIVKVFAAHKSNKLQILQGSCDGYHGKEEFYCYDDLYAILNRYNNNILLPAV